MLLVCAGVALLVATRGQQAEGEVSRAAPRPTPSGALPDASATPSPPAPSPSPSPTASAAPSPIAKPPVGPRPIPKPPLTVLNNSTVTGLGASAAARFRAAGWSIADVSGISGRYRYSTVYYGPGQLDAARELMRQFPAISVIEPRSLYPRLPGSGLTVVVTRDFA